MVPDRVAQQAICMGFCSGGLQLLIEVELEVVGMAISRQCPLYSTPTPTAIATAHIKHTQIYERLEAERLLCGQGQGHPCGSKFQPNSILLKFIASLFILSP